MVICLERGADLHIAQLMPLPLTVSCFSKIQIDFTFLEPAYPGSPGKRAIKWVCVCVCVYALGTNGGCGTDIASSRHSALLVDVARWSVCVCRQVSNRVIMKLSPDHNSLQLLL